MKTSISTGNFTFSDRKILSGSCYLSEGIVGEELSIDTLDAEVESLPFKPVPLVDANGHPILDTARYLLSVATPQDPPTVLPYGEPVNYTHKSGVVGHFYLSSVKRTGKVRYALHCVSAIGLLAGTQHKGGLYTGQTAGEVLADIIGGVISYTVDEKVASAKIYGWLPYATRRDNLHQVLFSLGANIVKQGSSIHIKYLDNSNPVSISQDRVYYGGSIDHKTAATEVQVTEHAFYATLNDAVNTLFDNTDGSGSVTNQLITFDGPHHSLTAAGSLVIVESGVNYAVLTGTGILTGKAYTHQTKVISRRSATVSGAERVVSITDATLVSLINSENVAARMLAYYSAAYHSTVGLVVGSERPGDAVAYTNPFGEEDTGLIQSMDITLSGTLKADTVIASGYAPSDGGNYFENVTVLTGSGRWTVPKGVKKLRVVLIGGGPGGTGGHGGQAGTQGPTQQKSNTTVSGGIQTTTYLSHRYPGICGEGGEGAPPAATGGRVYAVVFDVSEGQSFTYVCGGGGPGGAGGTQGNPGLPGSEGGATTFGSYTSSSGEAGSGFLELITGKVYATAGKLAGIAGGKGVSSMKTTTAGSGNINFWDTYQAVPGDTIVYNGIAYTPGSGWGGGPAAGANGGNTSASMGGSGASAHPPAARTEIGQGGDGGNGGGGGGCGVEGQNSSTRGYPAYPDGHGGPGGNGSAGGQGGPGGIIIYW